MNGNNVLGIIMADAYNKSLNEITALRTMASVPFGGRYRFIDFPLSNMVNSGIKKVGIVTKSNYQSLMDHVGSGRPWDLSRKNEGLFILPPFTLGSGIYSTRIEALCNIIQFLKKSTQEYVIISDCNFISNFDYSKMIDEHIEKNADITIAYKEGKVPELYDLMLFDLNTDGKITNVAVPPEKPENGKYSMNVIVIKKALLERLLNEAVSYEYKSFEKEIVQKNVNTLNITGYKVENFSLIIDSLNSYFDANMALLNHENFKALFNRNNPVLTKSADDMPVVYGIGCNVKNSIIADGCKIEGEVYNSVIFRGVTVEKGAIIKNSIIMHNAYIGEGSVLNCVIMDKNGVIRPRMSLSGAESYPIYIGKNIVI